MPMGPRTLPRVILVFSRRSVEGQVFEADEGKRYLWLRRPGKRCTVVSEVNDVRHTGAHESAADIRFHNRLDTRPCVGRDRTDTRYSVGPSAPKNHNEA
jgi:hypothetical protein